MTARLALVRGRVLPNGWVDLLRQCSLFGLAYLLYRLVEGMVFVSNSSVAFAHSREVISLERSLHIFVEPQIQAWATSSHLLVVIAAYIYINAQTTILIALLLYLYVAHNRNYYFVRNMLFVGMAIGLVGYGLFPTAPPRFLPEWGFIDTIHQDRERLLQPLRGDPVDARRLRRDARLELRETRPPPHRQGPVGAVAALHHLHDGDHRQPLPDRRDARGARCGRLVRGSAGARRTAPTCLDLPRAAACRRRRAAGPSPRHVSTPGTSERPPRPQRRVRPPLSSGETRAMVRNRLIESRLTPNAISLSGLALNLLAAALVWQRLYFVGGVAFIVGSIMDTFDGRYSRMSGKGTPFGAFLDSTLDRCEEGIVLTAVAVTFVRQHNQLAVAAVVVAVLASLMVSYTRARAEALGVECKVGIATRPVRVVILSVGLVFARGASLGDFHLLAPAVYVLALLSAFTVLQRIVHVHSELGGA
jgi:CDP-diacylglycerol--glycerol-3-phosphate 3-phosphatidyltransferase